MLSMQPNKMVQKSDCQIKWRFIGCISVTMTDWVSLLIIYKSQVRTVIVWAHNARFEKFLTVTQIE